MELRGILARLPFYKGWIGVMAMLIHVAHVKNITFSIIGVKNIGTHTHCNF